MSDLDPAQIIGALLLAAVALTATLATMSERRRQRARQIQAARRRHPSARKTMSDAERRYHESNQWGH